MSQQIHQPVQSIKLTNVAVVRYNKGKSNRYEIACYKNKIVNYKQGLETDLSEVLQTDRIFTNVSKGQFANKKDLKKHFNTTDEEVIAKFILQNGKIQVSDLEREQQYESMYREIANWISSNTVNPSSQRPYTLNQIRDAMKKSEFNVNPTKTVKKQCLDCMKVLQSKYIIPIERAKMELAVSVPLQHKDALQNKLINELNIVIPKEIDDSNNNANNNNNSLYRVTIIVDPSLYRTIDDYLKEINKDNSNSSSPAARLEIVRQVVTKEGDTNLEQDIEERRRQQKKQADDNNEQEKTASITQQMNEKLSIVEGNNEGVDNDDEVDEAIMIQQQHQQWQEQLDDDEEKNDNNEEQEEEEDENNIPLITTANNTTSRKQQQKKKQKQSKKAKRREKEEQIERQQRIDAERKRQEERDEQKRLGDSNNERQEEATPTTGSATNSTTKAKSCNTCGGSFATATLYREHFKSDWHRFNIKLKMSNSPPVTEEEFRLCDSDFF